jgi:hypothetical protein
MRRWTTAILLAIAGCRPGEPDVMDPLRPLTAEEEAVAAAWRQGLELCLEEDRLSLEGASWEERRALAEKAAQDLQFSIGRFLSRPSEPGREKARSIAEGLQDIFRISVGVTEACRDRDELQAARGLGRLAARLEILRTEIPAAGLFRF